MFSKNKLAAIRSLVAEGCRIQGDITFKDGIRIDGSVEGSLQGEAIDTKKGTLVFVAEHGRVTGGIKADVIIVNGSVEGPIYATRMLELQPKARISGDITYAQLEMHQGALISGCMMPILAPKEGAAKVLIEASLVPPEAPQLAAGLSEAGKDAVRAIESASQSSHLSNSRQTGQAKAREA